MPSTRIGLHSVGSARAQVLALLLLVVVVALTYLQQLSPRELSWGHIVKIESDGKIMFEAGMTG